MKKLALFVLLILSGCAPWPTTIQPETNLVIIDEIGKPIKGAVIKFASYKIAITPEVSIIELQTDIMGRVHIPKESYIQMIILAPDGGSSYDWAYCIEKSGYTPVSRKTLNESHFSNGEVVEVMSQTNITSKCYWQDFPHEFIVVENKP